MVIVDTNIILRYLLNDVEELNEKAKDIIDNNDILIPNEIAVEVCYVLQKVYKVEKEIIYTLIVELMAQDNVYFENRSIIYEAFKTFAKQSLDMVDCMLYAYSVVENKEIKSFDNKLMKLLSKQPRT